VSLRRAAVQVRIEHRRQAARHHVVLAGLVLGQRAFAEPAVGRGKIIDLDEALDDADPGLQRLALQHD
jgi:hypothetical protein